MPTKVIILKAAPPVEGIEVVAEQASAAHKYYNKLIELHRAFADAREKAKRKHSVALEAAITNARICELALEELRDQIKKRNAAATKRTASAEDRTAVKNARAQLATARTAVRAERAAVRNNADYLAELAALIVEYQGTLTDPDDSASRREGGKFKDARRDCATYSGSYLRVEAAVDAAVNSSATNGQPPKFRRWDGRALLGPQLTPALPIALALGGEDTRLRIERIHSPASKNRSDRLLVWLRVASDENKKPIWAKVKCHLSKGQLPDDALVTWATLVRWQVGVRRHKHPTIKEGVWLPYYEWSVQLTIRTEVVKSRATDGACGINIGWRLQGDGTILVATVADNAGQTERLYLPKRLLDRFSRVTDLQEIRDTHFNAAKFALRTWLTARSIPDWLAEHKPYLDQWKSPRRLARLYAQWCENRFDGDDEPFKELHKWREREGHLEQYQLTLHRGAVRRRLELYRAFAARIRKRYSRIVVEDTDYRTLFANPEAESTALVIATAKRNVQIASPGELRKCLTNAGAVEAVATDITRTCHACGSVELFDHVKEVFHTCSKCHAIWDQDQNAAKNLLRIARGQVVNTSPGTARGPDDAPEKGDTETTPDKGGKWAKRKSSRSRNNADTATKTEVTT